MMDEFFGWNSTEIKFLDGYLRQIDNDRNYIESNEFYSEVQMKEMNHLLSTHHGICSTLKQQPLGWRKNIIWSNWVH